MKHYLWLFMLACPVLLAETVDIHDFPKGALGIFVNADRKLIHSG